MAELTRERADERRSNFLTEAYGILFEGDVVGSAAKRQEVWKSVQQFAESYQWQHTLVPLDRGMIAWLRGAPGEDGETLVPGWLFEGPRNAYEALPESMAQVDLGFDQKAGHRREPSPAAAASRVERCVTHLRAGWPDCDCVGFVNTKEEWRLAVGAAQARGLRRVGAVFFEGRKPAPKGRADAEQFPF